MPTFVNYTCKRYFKSTPGLRFTFTMQWLCNQGSARADSWSSPLAGELHSNYSHMYLPEFISPLRQVMWLTICVWGLNSIYENNNIMLTL